MSTLDQALAGAAPAIKIGSATISLTKPIATTTPAARPAPVGGSLTAGVNAALAKAKEPPKSLKLGRTGELQNHVHMHALLYSETSARKTTTAAKFGNRVNTRFIITRRSEQLIPLQNMDYQYAEVQDADALLYALQFPERLWPGWLESPDPTLVFDDATEGVQLLLEGHDDEKDGRRSYGLAGDDLRDAIRSLLRKQLNLIVVCLAKVKENALTTEERISPDLPPSMMNMVLAEFEFAFYINPQTYQFTTDKDFFSYEGTDPNNPNKVKTFKRQIFAKHKISEELARATPKVIEKYEPMDLRALWNKVKAAEAKIKTGGK